MKLDVVIPIDGFDNEEEFTLLKVDDFFSVLRGCESQKELKLLSFGALKKLNFDLPDHVIRKFEIEDTKDISIYYVFVLQTSSSANKMNVLAPIIVNNKLNKIGQVHFDIHELGLESLSDILPKF